MDPQLTLKPDLKKTQPKKKVDKSKFQNEIDEVANLPDLWAHER